MATTLVFTVAPYQPFTKILSANINQDKADIKSRINWAGGTSTTTGLGDDNLQSNTVSGGGLTRATKLKLGAVNAFISNSSTGAIQDVASGNNQTLFTSNTGVPTAGTLPLLVGGTGVSLSLTNPGDVLQVNSGASALVLSTPPLPPLSRISAFYNFG